MSGSGCGATMVPDDLRHAAYLGCCYRVADCTFALVLPEVVRRLVKLGALLSHGRPAAVAQDDACAQHPGKQLSTDVSSVFCCSYCDCARTHCRPHEKLQQYSPSIRSINPRRTSLLSRVRPVSGFSSGFLPVLLAAQFACRSKEALLCILRASQWQRRCSLRHSAAHCPVLPAENDRPATHSSRQALPD
jgi:hypothetical protein